MSEKTKNMYEKLKEEFESGNISPKEYVDRYNKIMLIESEESMEQNQEREFI